MRAADTSLTSARTHADRYRSLGPEARAGLAAEMSDEIWAVAESGIRARHPEYDDDQIAWALRRLRLGDEVLRQAWPDAPLIRP